MTESPPQPVEVADFKFKLHTRLKVYPESWNLSLHRPTKLVATASKYGLVFVGTKNGFQCIRTEDIQPHDPQMTNHNVTSYKRRNFPLPYGGGTHLDVSCDNELLAVTQVSGDLPLLHVYCVATVASPNLRRLSEVRLSTTPGVYVVDLQWNPGVANMIAAVMSDGSASVIEFKNGSFAINSIPQNAQASCLCWSPKGKQVVIGGKNGSLIQYKPELKAVKSLNPPKLGPATVSVVSVHWISNFQFIAVYKDAANPRDDSKIVIVNCPKNAEIKYIHYSELIYESETSRPEYYFIHQQTWNVLVIGATGSMEAVVLKADDAGQWCQWTMEEGSRPELPLTSDYRDVSNVGMALDLSSIRPIVLGDKQISPMPMVLMYAHNGVLCFFNMINTLPGAANLCQKPQPLPDLSALHLFTCDVEKQNTTEKQPESSEAEVGGGSQGAAIPQNSSLTTGGVQTGLALGEKAGSSGDAWLSGQGLAKASFSGFGQPLQPPPGQSSPGVAQSGGQTLQTGGLVSGGLQKPLFGLSPSKGSGLGSPAAPAWLSPKQSFSFTLPQPQTQPQAQPQPQQQQQQQQLQTVLQQQPLHQQQQQALAPQQQQQMAQFKLQQAIQQQHEANLPLQQQQQAGQPLQQHQQQATQLLQQQQQANQLQQQQQLTNQLQQQQQQQQANLPLQQQQANQQQLTQLLLQQQKLLLERQIQHEQQQLKVAIAQGQQQKPVALQQPEQTNSSQLLLGSGTPTSQPSAKPPDGQAQAQDSADRKVEGGKTEDRQAVLQAAQEKAQREDAERQAREKEAAMAVQRTKELIEEFSREMESGKKAIQIISARVDENIRKSCLKDKVIQDIENLNKFEDKLLKNDVPDLDKVNALGNSLMEMFGWYEKMKAKEKMTKSSRYIELMESQDLDPVTKSYITSIDKHIYYLESQIKQAKNKLSALWENLGPAMEIPVMETIYQSLVALRNIIETKRALIETYETKLKKINQSRLYRSSRRKTGDLVELSLLAERLLQTKLDDKDLVAESSLENVSANYIALANKTAKKAISNDKVYALHEWHRQHRVIKTKASQQAANNSLFAKDQTFGDFISPSKQSTPYPSRVGVKVNAPLPRKSLFTLTDLSSDEHSKAPPSDLPAAQANQGDTSIKNNLAENFAKEAREIKDKEVTNLPITSSDMTNSKILTGMNEKEVILKIPTPAALKGEPKPSTPAMSVSTTWGDQTPAFNLKSLSTASSVTGSFFQQSSFPMGTTITASNSGFAMSTNAAGVLTTSRQLPQLPKPTFSQAPQSFQNPKTDGATSATKSTVSSEVVLSPASESPAVSNALTSKTLMFNIQPSKVASSNVAGSSTGFSTSGSGLSLPSSLTITPVASSSPSQGGLFGTSFLTPASLPKTVESDSISSSIAPGTQKSTTTPPSTQSSSAIPTAKHPESTKPTESLFSAAPNVTVTSGFGTIPTTASLLFGTSPSTNISTGFSFGGASSSLASGSIFGATSTTPNLVSSAFPSVNFGNISSTTASSAGAPAVTSSLFFGSSAAAGSQLFAPKKSDTSVSSISSTQLSDSSAPCVTSAPSTTASNDKPTGLVVTSSTPTTSALNSLSSFSFAASTPPSTTSSLFSGTSAVVSSAASVTVTTASVTAPSSLPTTTTSATSLFGGSAVTTTAPSTSTETPTKTTSLFGLTSGTTTSQSLFGNTSSFSAAPTSTSIFGSSTTSTLAKTTASLFGSSATTTTSSSFFGGTTSSGSIFGGGAPAFSAAATAATTQAFGATTSSFGTTTAAPTFGSTTTAPAFGTTTAAPAFGATTTSSFGTTATPTFGSTTTAPAFGATTAAPAFGATTTTAPFGATTTSSTFGSSTSTSAFGAANALASTSFFGSPTTTSSSTFGNQSAGSIFGGAPSFGSPVSTSSSSSFFGKTICSPTPTSNVFGTTSNVFGQTAATTSTSSIFGGSSSFQQKTSTFGQSGNLFGQTTSPNGNFGSSGGSLFGGAATFSNPAGQQTNIFQSGGGGGSVFGGSPSAGGGAFTSPQAGQSSFGAPPSFQSSQSGGIFGSAAAPAFGSPPTFGSSPTFGGSPAFGGSPTKPFGAPATAATGFGTPPQQENSTFANLAQQDTPTFGNLAQQQTFSSNSFAGSSFSSWRR